MRCSECECGKRFAEGSVYCHAYGIIIRADHECELPAARLREAEVINLKGFLNDRRSDAEDD